MASNEDVSRLMHSIDDATPDETARSVNELSALFHGRLFRWDLVLSGAMPEALRDRLLRVLAMTSSTYQGEVWTALDRAADIVRKAGLNWMDILPFEGKTNHEASAQPTADASPSLQQATAPEAADASASAGIASAETTPTSPASKPQGMWEGIIFSWRTNPGVVLIIIAPAILFFIMVETVLRSLAR